MHHLIIFSKKNDLCLTISVNKEVQKYWNYSGLYHILMSKYRVVRLDLGKHFRFLSFNGDLKRTYTSRLVGKLVDVV